MAFVALAVLFLGVPLQIAVFLAARWSVAVMAGVPGAWVPFRRFDAPPKGAPRWARPAVGLAGPAATYLIAVLCFVVALKTSDKPEYDATVEVKQGSPAELAGIRSGDRVISIQGRPVATFDDISARVRELGQTGPLEIVVERGGTNTTVTVTPALGPDGQPKIGVKARAPVRYVSIGLGEAIPRAITMPVQWASGLLSMLRGAEGEVELAGPAAIARASASAPTSTALTMFGVGLTEIGAFLGILAVIFALFGWRPLTAGAPP